MENTYWLKYLHQKLRDHGIPVQGFALDTRLNTTHLETTEYDRVPLITKKELIDLQKKGFTPFEVLLETKREEALSQNWSFEVENKRGVLSICLRRDIILIAEQSHRINQRYRAYNCVDVEHTYNQENLRMSVEGEVGEDVINAYPPHIMNKPKEMQILLEDLFPTDYEPFGTTHDKVTQELNALSPQEWLDNVSDLINNCYHRIHLIQIKN